MIIHNTFIGIERLNKPRNSEKYVYVYKYSLLKQINVFFQVYIYIYV